MDLSQKNTGVLPVTTFVFRKFYFSLRTLYKELIWRTKELIWRTNYPDIHMTNIANFGWKMLMSAELIGFATLFISFRSSLVKVKVY